METNLLNCTAELPNVESCTAQDQRSGPMFYCPGCRGLKSCQ